MAKLERGHARDLDDVRAMYRLGMIEAAKLSEYFELLFPQLYRFPAIDPASFRQAVVAFLTSVRP